MKRWFFIGKKIGTVGVLLILFFILSTMVFAGEIYEIKFAQLMDTSHHYQYGAEKFKELAEEGSDGRIQVEIFPNAQLGAEREELVGMQLGSIQMTIATSAIVSTFVPEFSIVDLGYLFKDNKEAQKVLNGELGNKLSEKMLPIGIRNLGFIDCGFRSVYGQKAYTTPDDLKGTKIRLMATPAHQELFKALGANPIPMSWTELYTGLQQGTVDAAENVVDVYYASKHYEIAKHYSWTNHVYLGIMFMISEKFYQGLPSDLQELVVDSAKKAISYENEIFIEKKKEAIEKLGNAGVVFHDVPNIEAFQNLAKKSWEVMAQTIPEGKENLDIIMKTLKE